MGEEGREEEAGAGADELLLMLQMKQMISPLSLSVPGGFSGSSKL